MDPNESDLRLVRVQALSGVTFAAFLLVHLANQMIAALGPGAYDATQRTLARAYQWAPIEIALVLAPLAIHAAAAITRIVRRRRRGQKAPSGVRARLHRIAGLYLLVFFVGHVVATRGASAFFGVYPRFAGVAFTLEWVPAYFWPYYIGLALAGLYHLVYGIGVALPVLGLREGRVLRRPALVAAITVIGGAALLAGILAFGGVVEKVEHPEQSEYARLLQRLGIARSTTR